MKKTISILMMALMIPLVSGQSLSPTVIATAGGNLSNANVSLSFTAGEVAVTTLQGTSLILTQGFQQPFELDVAGAVNDLSVNWTVQAYPNPVFDYLTIRFELDKPIEIIIDVTDILGRTQILMNRSMITPGETRELDFTGLSNGIYIMHLTTPDRKTRQTFKIIKK